MCSRKNIFHEELFSKFYRKKWNTTSLLTLLQHNLNGFSFFIFQTTISTTTLPTLTTTFREPEVLCYGFWSFHPILFIKCFFAFQINQMFDIVRQHNSKLLWLEIRQSTIYYAWTMEWTNRRPRVWCSKYYFLILFKDLGHSKLCNFIFLILKKK